MTDSVQGNVSMTSGRAVNPNSPQRTRRKGPSDFTGKQMQDLQVAHQEELAAREHELGLANAAAQAVKTEEIDLTEARFMDAPEVSLKPVEVKTEKVHGVRVNMAIENMTYGREVIPVGDPTHPLGDAATEPYIGGLKTFSFNEGQPYTMWRDMYDYLDDKGYIWH